MEEEKVTSKWQRWKGIMKCVPFEEKRLAKWQPPYIVQPKLDGDRCRNLPLGDHSVLLSSEENIFYSVPHINQQLVNLSLHRIELDGELYNHDIHAEGGHELIHSICSRSMNLHERYDDMEFWIFDIKVRGISQMERIHMLNKLQSSQNVRISPYWICDTLDDIKRVYDSLVDKGFEGIVVRHLYNIYEDKRSTLLMKFKPKKTDIYSIIGWKEEVSIDGTPKGRIGSLILSSQNGDEFGVSAGLNSLEKDQLWLIRDQLKGKKAIVHYQHLTNNNIPKGTFDIEVLDV
jgi:ATP-dependent DNA ligase